MPVCVAYIGIGSNLADPEVQVQTAIQQLKHLPQTEIYQQSSLYRSQPMGPQDQPDYINAVVSIKTALEPLQLLDALQQMEAEHGRIRDGVRWGPRTLDLDILLYDEKMIKHPHLSVPHPGLHERAFVLYPLHEINPDLTIPAKGSLSELLAVCPTDGLEKIIT